MTRQTSRPQVQLAGLALAFAAGTLVAKLAGAGWGTAAAFGQMTFAAVLVAVLLLSPRPPSARDSG